MVVSMVVMCRIETTHLEDRAHSYARTCNAAAVHRLSFHLLGSSKGQAHIAITPIPGSMLRSRKGVVNASRTLPQCLVGRAVFMPVSLYIDIAVPVP